MDDLISRQAAIRFIRDKVSLSLFMKRSVDKADKACVELCEMLDRGFPSAQSETSRIENALHGKSAEEQYDFLRWLMQDYGMRFTDTRAAVIEWLRGERNG